MSFGALLVPAVRTLSKGVAMAGCWLNTGEGELAPYHLEGGCDVIFQIGTAKYGVRTPDGQLDEARVREIASLPQVKMFELKLSQGAKPGKGGILPAIKVTPEIAQNPGNPRPRRIRSRRTAIPKSIASLIFLIKSRGSAAWQASPSASKP